MAVMIDPKQDLKVTTNIEEELPWVTIVWNDPVNLMSYVTYVLQNYFGYSHAKANKLMLKVHEEGKVAVSSGTKTEMEKDTQALHSFGLWATYTQK